MYDLEAWRLTQPKREKAPDKFLSIYDDDRYLDPDEVFNEKENEIEQEGLKEPEKTKWF